MNILYTPTAVAIGLVYAYLPFMVLPIYTSLEKIDWRLFEAALDLGATRWVTLRRIVIPLAMPGIVAGCLLVFVPALGAYYIPELLGGGKQMMIGSLIQAQFGTGRNWPFGSALAFALLGLVLLGMLLYARAINANETLHNSHLNCKSRPAIRASRPFHFLFSGPALEYGAGADFSVPAECFLLVASSFNENKVATLWAGFSLHWYGVVFDNPNIVRATKNFLIVALSASAISTVLATMAALAMAGPDFCGKPQSTA